MKLNINKYNNYLPGSEMLDDLLYKDIQIHINSNENKIKACALQRQINTN